ncbi:MAG: C4-dicarboxylate ABC transporter, partial [Actinobacteria bacterium]
MRGDAHTPPQASPLPSAGPIWFPSVMGTGILGTLLQSHAHHLPGAEYGALVSLALSWVLLAVISLIFIFRSLRHPSVFIESVTSPAIAPFWGAVSLGIMSVGSATSLVIPTHFPSLAPIAWAVESIMWIIGTIIGIISAITFGVRLLGLNLGTPSTIWGLAIVGPMLSATTGATLAPHIRSENMPFLLFFAGVCFFLSFFLGLLIFAYTYHYHWRIAPIPLEKSASAWIPLGLVGQSMAAAQALALQVRPMVRPIMQDASASIANFYSWVIFFGSIPLIIWALKV